MKTAALAALLALAVAPPPANDAFDRGEAAGFAREFFSHALAGDVAAVASNCMLPFQLEGARLSAKPELIKALSHALRERPVTPGVLEGVEILTPAEMEAKHGKPPARLRDFPWKRPGTWIAVANLSGHAAVITLSRREDGAWAATAYSD